MNSEKILSTYNITVMCAATTEKKPNMIASILRCKCPRCRKGDMFQTSNPYDLKRFMKMNDRCPVCGQPLDMEPGFYYGTNMISYALAVLFSVLSLLLWWALIGFSLEDTRFLWWILVNALLLVAIQPPLMRISRAVWIAFFVRYSPNWREGDIIERYSINEEQAGNW